MLDKTDDISLAADNWLAQFEDALAKPDEGLLKTLFLPESYWRDVLALSWNIQTLNGADAILGELKIHARRAAPSGFAIDPDRRAPRKVMRAGTNAIEAIFKFETAVGRGSGIIRLIPDVATATRSRHGRCSPNSANSKVLRSNSASRARAATPIRAIFAARTGSICATHRPDMPTAIPSSS